MQRDYILRLIEQAGAVLKVLLEKIGARSADRAELSAGLRRAARLGGLDLDLLRLCDGPALMQLVAPFGDADPSRTWLAAETLYLDGLAAAQDGQPADAMASFAKAALLYGMVEPTWVLPTGFPEATARLDEIAGRLSALGDGSPGSGGAPP
jgi:hypothetical protein